MRGAVDSHTVERDVHGVLDERAHESVLVVRLVHLHPPVELAELCWIEPIQVRRDALRGAAARREGARRVPADEVVVGLARAVEFLLARRYVVDAAAQRLCGNRVQ